MGEKHTIVAARLFPEAVEQRLARDYAATLNPTDTRLDRAALVSASAGADGLLISANELMDAWVIERLAPSVSIVATLSVGLDHIDLAAARRRGLVVCHTPDVLDEACADTAMLLLLAAARRAREGDRMVRSGAWTGWAPTQLLGAELRGQILGIAGMGRIGRALARRARGFGLEIHYHNRRPLPADLESGARYHESFESLLAVSRFLSLNFPATPATRGILDSRRIELLPPGAIVVNIARGDLIDDDALIAALKSGRIAAAGLDVFDGEPNIHPGYRALDSVFMMPHAGSATVETRNAMGFALLDSFDAHFAGKPVPNRAE